MAGNASVWLDFTADNESANVNYTLNITDTLFEKVGLFGYSTMSPLEICFTIGILLLITVFTVVGNVLVIMSVCTYRPLRSAQNFFIVSLALADLTVAFLVLPFNVAYITMGRWIFGQTLCQLWLTCDILCCTASILNLAAIALDRYRAITDPINYANKRTLRMVLSMIAGVWALSFLICLPPLLGWNDWSKDIFDVCELSTVGPFVIFSSMGSFFIPLILILIVYVKIFCAIRRRSRERANQSKINQINSGKERFKRSEESFVSDNGQNGQIRESSKKKLGKKKWSKSNLMDCAGSAEKNSTLMPGTNPKEESTSEQERHPPTLPVLSPQTLSKELKTTDVIVKIAPGGANQIHQFVEERQKISLTKERRAARTLGIIVGVFIVCWLPFFLMYVIGPFCNDCFSNRRIINFIVWLGYINSSLNPVIYTIFNEEFRKAFGRLLRCSEFT